MTNGGRRKMKKSKASLIPTALSSSSTPLKQCLDLQNLALVHCSLQSEPYSSRTRLLSEHFHQRLNRPSSVDPSVLELIPQRAVIEELDDPPSLDEVRKAIKQMSNGKAPGRDGMSAEIFKALSNEALQTSGKWKKCQLTFLTQPLSHKSRTKVQGQTMGTIEAFLYSLLPGKS